MDTQLLIRELQELEYLNKAFKFQIQLNENRIAEIEQQLAKDFEYSKREENND